MMDKQLLFYGSSITLSHLQASLALAVIGIDDPQFSNEINQEAIAIIIDINDIEADLAWLSSLQNNAVVAHIPKIAITYPDYFESALTAGATELLYKPLNLLELQTRLNTLLHHQQDSLVGALDVIAHDINSPLGIIEYSLQLALEILEDGPNALPDIRQFIVNMLTASYRLRLMSMDTLDYIRLKNNQLSPTKTTLDIDQLIQRSIQNTSPIGRENHIEIVHHPAATPISLKTDAGLLQRIIEAALDTSIKFCQPRSTIEIATYRDHNHIVITIKDPGQGVDYTYLPNAVFMPYSQSTMREAGKRSAVGLSLPFIAAAVEALVGLVRLDSDGDHTTLTLLLPSD